MAKLNEVAELAEIWLFGLGLVLGRVECDELELGL